MLNYVSLDDLKDSPVENIDWGEESDNTIIICDHHKHIDDTGKEFYFYKNKPADKVWWIRYVGRVGPLPISFDKHSIYNLWPDYPQRMTAEKKKIFDEENPFWAEFFRPRTESAAEKDKR